jgi:hypothetical protein
VVTGALKGQLSPSLLTFELPFQGAIRSHVSTQGVALGYYQLPFQGANHVPYPKKERFAASFLGNGSEQREEVKTNGWRQRSTRLKSLLGHHGKENQILVAVVDERMGGAFRTIVAVAGLQTLLSAVAHGPALSTEHEDNLAARVVGVHADRRAGHQTGLHDAVVLIGKHLGH